MIRSIYKMTFPAEAGMIIIFIGAVLGGVYHDLRFHPLLNVAMVIGLLLQLPLLYALYYEFFKND